MLRMKLNLDPTLKRVALIGFLLMAQLILFKLIEILATGRQPTAIETELLACEGLALLVTYLVTFLQKEEPKVAER